MGPADAKSGNLVLHPRYRLQVKASWVTKPLLAVIGVGIVYVVAIVVLHVRGAGIVAAYLTMPAWFLVAGISMALSAVSPGSALDAMLFSWSGNLVALIVSGALNVAAAFAVVRLISKT